VLCVLQAERGVDTLNVRELLLLSYMERDDRHRSDRFEIRKKIPVVYYVRDIQIAFDILREAKAIHGTYHKNSMIMWRVLFTLYS